MIGGPESAGGQNQAAPRARRRRRLRRAPANQSLSAPTACGATTMFKILATSSEMAMNMLRMWHGDKLFSNPKQGPM